MLIKVKNEYLFQAWLKHYECKCFNHMLPAEKRTYSFIKSNKGMHPPSMD